ncbi:MAG: hypothetical protein ACOVLB_02725 [Candidatus Nanopelagicus sp.]
MAVFFNLELLEAESQCDPKLMLSMLERHFYKKLIPKNRREQSYKNLSGHSFLLNVAPLFKDTVDIAYKVQYIRLAGRRDYSLYKFYKATYLDLSFFKDIDLELIKHNPLLKIDSNKIYFKYESK